MRVAIYARYSTDRQDSRSIDDQIRRCTQFAVANAHTVVGVYQDQAVSGSHLQRPEMQQMRADLKQRGGAPFEAILCDDLSRISRDLGDAWSLIFGELPIYKVALVDCSTGMASSHQGAKLTMGVQSLMNSAFLDMVRHETQRGMERRAIDGYATGGRTFGYDTFKEENPPDPEHPRSVVAINEREAAIVRRVFTLWLEGKPAKRIADILNAEGIPAPHDGGKGNKGNRGWPHTTIGYMLKNERYVGRLIWNQSQWIKLPGSKKRKHVKRPRTEWTIKPAEHLRIIDEATYEAAQARFRKSKPGRPAGTSKKAPSLLAGMLKCGVCQGNMILASRRASGFASFLCTTHDSRGASICANDRLISEGRVTSVVLAELKEQFATPDATAQFVAGFEHTIRALETARDKGDVADLEKQLRAEERELENLIGSLARMGFSQVLADEIQRREVRKSAIRVELDRQREPFEPYRLPSRRELHEHFAHLTHIVQGDTTATREALMQAEGTFTITPDLSISPSAWHLEGSYNVSAILLPRNHNARSPLEGPGTMVVNDGSGGRI